MKRSLVATVVVACTLVLGACGGGGSDGGSATGFLPNVPLTITTTALPDGTTLAPYTTTQIEVDGADGPVAWTLLSGTLPQGLTLSGGGVLSGQPTQNAVYTFEVEATDGTDTVSRSFDVTIADFTFSVTGGLIGSDAWTEAPVTLTTVGATGTVTFSIVASGSGGSFTSTDGAAGTATWTPGTLGGTTDRLEARDAGTGLQSEVVLTVEDNPAPFQVAEFGSTDVWYLDTSGKRGSHQHRTDFLQSLADIGLLPQGTGSATPTPLEVLVETTARLTLLREMNLIFLRDASGQTGSGVDISFPFAAPDPAVYSAPSEGNFLSGSMTRYSIMELADRGPTGDAGVLGRAFFDPTNPEHENNSGNSAFGGNRLGTFTDRVRESFASWQSSRLLVSDPVGPSDSAIIEDILYGRPSSGSRHDEIEELMVFFARALALVSAHEMGHSIGFDHNGGTDVLMAPSIGFSTANLSTSNAVPFLASEITTMRNGNLPGAGRSSTLRTLVEDTGPVEVRVVTAASP